MFGVSEDFTTRSVSKPTLFETAQMLRTEALAMEISTK